MMYTCIFFSFSCGPDDRPTEVMISHVHCPIVSDYSLYGELHIMRCSVGNVSVPQNTCQHFTALRCSESL